MSEGDTESRLVWIMGSPRSGSTWLLRLLAHPWRLGSTPTGIDQPALLRGGGNILPIDESYLPHHLGPLRDNLSEAARGSDPPLINDTRAGSSAYFFAAEFEAAWHPALRSLVTARFDAQAAAAKARHGIEDPLIVIKEPNGSHAAELVARLLPNSRLIFLQRDGRDVIDSMLEADSPGGWRTRTESVRPVATPQQRLEFVRRQAELWLIRTRAVQRACERLGPDRSISLRYEDLLSDTYGELARLDGWLGIGRDSQTLRQAVRTHRFGSVRNRLRGKRKGVRAASPGLWRQNLSSEEAAIVNRLLGPTLDELGY